MHALERNLLILLFFAGAIGQDKRPIANLERLVKSCQSSTFDSYLGRFRAKQNRAEKSGKRKAQERVGR
jgi:hypothetical protein